MENLKIAVVSPDESYNRAFCVALLDACRQISLTSYTTGQFVSQWADRADLDAFYDGYDIILWAGDEIRDSYGGKIVYLTDRISLTDMDYDRGRFALYKYSRAGRTVASVFDIYSHLTGHQARLVKRNDVKLYAISSCRGGTGCTTTARAVAQEFVRFRDKRVLCLSLEEVDSSGDFLVLRDGVRSEGEFLYKLLGKGKMPFLESYLVRDDFGISSFLPPAGKNPMRDLSKRDMEQLLAALMQSGAFDVIIADLSTSLGDAAAAVADAADSLCLISRSKGPDEREQRYLQQLASCCEGDIRKKIVRQIREEDGQETELSRRQEGLEGKFGREVCNLTERMLHVVK